MERRGGIKRKRGAKGDILLRVLENVADGVVDAALLFEAFLEAGHDASQRKIEHTHERQYDRYLLRTSERGKGSGERVGYQKFISRIRKDGLVEQKGERGTLLLTKRGKDKLMALQDRKQRMLPPVRRYDAERADAFTIVAFDVPERFKRKRDWLRAALREIGFTFVQKSVWLGKMKLPEDFLEDVRTLKLSEYLEIFQITKRGTLRRLE